MSDYAIDHISFTLPKDEMISEIPRTCLFFKKDGSVYDQQNQQIIYIEQDHDVHRCFLRRSLPAKDVISFLFVFILNNLADP